MNATDGAGATALAPTSPAPDAAVIQLRDVVKEYPGDPPTRVLQGVDLVVRRGELLAIVGPSGSGKSTLLHIMGTLDRPTAGDVHIAGHDVARLADRQLSALRARAIGFVFQQFFLLPGMSATDNVADGLLYTGRRLRDRQARAREALERVGLGHRLDYNTEKLSGGERQRVAVARALVGEPEVVLADEPTGNLDSRSSDALVDLLHELNDDGSTIVVITHDHDIAGRLRRQVAIRDGLIEADVTHGAPEAPGTLREAAR
ncbi:MAG TPA: ABC transporter ATP-binding protein [Acidimicrobiales bacterium]|nr:ABC transporter ATP-binding protein [Acidimicrobiales bacterium]